MEYSAYQSGVSGKDGTYFSPSTSPEMARSPSGSSSTSSGSYKATSPWGSRASLDDNALESPGGKITNEFSYLDDSADNGAHQSYNIEYTEAESDSAHNGGHQPYNIEYTEAESDSAHNGGHQSYNIEYTGAESDSYQPQISYHTPVQGDAESSQDDSWCQFYDFIAQVEQGQPPYWRLKAEYTANDDYPMYKPCQDSEIKSRSGHLNICLEPGCKSKPFKRKADLERHYQQVHWDSSAKRSFPCDYAKCSRSTNPFYRSDHYRDHCRDYHREDLLRRSSSKKETSEWWADRIIHKRWWRCSKCLHRVYIQQNGFECHNCKTHCEPQRRNYRVQK
ncbi:hypothetical protein DL768_008232 [Monosporascus sp. mg162]|nr:hypothetical protein DL768_008232 [Monosporascus sp. mg162]